MKTVKIITTEDGEKIQNPKWCLVTPSGFCDAPRSLCSGQAFGEGESSAKYTLREGGQVTCPECRGFIKKNKGS